VVSGLVKDERNLRRLAGSGRTLNDHDLVVRQGVEYPIALLVDGEVEWIHRLQA
jgi:hypothetical protein